MLLLSANKICEECLACNWLDLNLTQSVVFTKRLVGAFKGPEKWRVEKRLVSLGLCFPAFAGESSMSADLDVFGGRLMTLSSHSRRQEVGTDAQGHSAF